MILKWCNLYNGVSLYKQYCVPYVVILQIMCYTKVLQFSSYKNLSIYMIFLQKIQVHQLVN